MQICISKDWFQGLTRQYSNSSPGLRLQAGYNGRCWHFRSLQGQESCFDYEITRGIKSSSHDEGQETERLCEIFSNNNIDRNSDLVPMRQNLLRESNIFSHLMLTKISWVNRIIRLRKLRLKMKLLIFFSLQKTPTHNKVECLQLSRQHMEWTLPQSTNGYIHSAHVLLVVNFSMHILCFSLSNTLLKRHYYYYSYYYYYLKQGAHTFIW